jgi:hypothetical protein
MGVEMGKKKNYNKPYLLVYSKQLQEPKRRRCFAKRSRRCQ